MRCRKAMIFFLKLAAAKKKSRRGETKISNLPALGILSRRGE